MLTFSTDCGCGSCAGGIVHVCLDVFSEYPLDCAYYWVGDIWDGVSMMVEGCGGI